MFSKLNNPNFLCGFRQRICFVQILLFALLPLFFYGQTVIDGFTFIEIPKEKQLYARNISDKGTIVVQGSYDRTMFPEQYDHIEIRIRRNGLLYGPVYNQELIYVLDEASFNLSMEIDAELANYTFEIYGQELGIYTPVTVVDEIVAGDVYIIQGQSNAEARRRTNFEGDSGDANVYASDFIRVYANGAENFASLVNNDNWYIADGNITRNGNGNTGQWGLRLARLIVDSENVPVAIFNGARGGRAISYFLESNPNDSGQTNNYTRLLYRLEQTNLKNAVKAVLWSQGETVTNINNVADYKNAFLDLKNSWESDYPSLQKFYIFQSRTGCASTTDLINLMHTKEAERQLATENADIHIMSTDGLVQFNDECHFMFVDGYEKFATRIFELIRRDFYGGISGEIEPPNITNAYLSNETTLIVETDAAQLYAGIIADNFELGSVGSAYITNIAISNNDITFNLSENPGLNATISNLGSDPGINNNLITNVSLTGIELVSFYEFPIDASAFTIWSGGAWSNNVPDASMDAIIADNYTAFDGNIVAKNLTINSGIDVDFNNSTTNSIVIYGDLTINGNFTIGDTESLVMYDDNAFIYGYIAKFESSTFRSNSHDVTYWSSPVSNTSVENVFAGVDPNRIYLYDQTQTSSVDPSDTNYYDVWVVASGSMASGKGYASEGLSGTTGSHNVLFFGEPNNGLISIGLDRHNDSESDNDFNLIGNPYPSAIDIDLFFDYNSNLDGNAYLWTHSTPISNGNSGDFVSSDYATYNLSGGINPSGGPIPTNNFGSGQGFFVRAINSGAASFNNSMRIIDSNDQFYKLENSKSFTKIKEKDRVWLNIETDQGGINQLLIAFDERATNEVDRGYDAPGLDGGNVLSFYSLIKEGKYVIQGLGAFSKDKIINIGFDINVSPRNLSISIDNVEGILRETDIYIVDNKLNVTHDLKKSNYQFEETVTGEYQDRFALQFTKSGTVLNVDDIVGKDDFIISNEQEKLKFESSMDVKLIKIYDMLGRILISNKPNARSFEYETKSILPGTILLIEASFENGSVINRKTIKY